MTSDHAHRHYGEDMLSVEEALERILTVFSPLAPEEKPLLEALGQVLAEDAVAAFDIPPLPNSAMDGYAVRHDDIRGASATSPKTLRVIGLVAAGQVPQQAVAPGTAIRIMTGAPIPAGADTVVPFEDTDELQRKAAGRSLQEIAIRLDVGRGASVRPAGEDVARREKVLSKGTILRPQELGVLASLGHSRVMVIRRPVVAVLATGDELEELGQPLGPGKIYDSNTYSVAAAVLRYGGVPHLLGIARDNLEDMEAKVAGGLHADLLITSAGVSKGDYDVVKDVLMRQGHIGFWSVRMRPAKPLAFGLLRGPGGRQVPHLGLPGNPVSAMVAFEAFARPAILKMQGKTRLRKPTIEAVLEDPIHNNDGRRVYARVTVARRNGAYYARTTGAQGSNLLTSMAKAKGLAICPEDTPGIQAGQRVQVWMLDWPEEVEV
ncbi:MAG: molybdopterin molybdenumtransferase MoeA [Dehalococcoidia bacterium]|nr:molybdopterin molybdenumtransferase MoeA [Dehalococcoidia bacterium]